MWHRLLTICFGACFWHGDTEKMLRENVVDDDVGVDGEHRKVLEQKEGQDHKAVVDVALDVACGGWRSEFGTDKGALAARY